MNHCPIWGTQANILAQGSDGMKVQSPRTDGEYRISGTASSQAQRLSPKERALLTTWIVEQRRAGEIAPHVNSEVLESCRTRRPLSVSQRKARFFMLALTREFQPSSRFTISGEVNADQLRDNGALCAWMECQADQDLGAILRLLSEEGLVNFGGSAFVSLTSKGFERLESIEAKGADTRQAFVAMWFGPEMAEVCNSGIEPAIRDAGFDPLRIDRKEHNNKIDDEIIAEIRRSRFVVADFTSGTIMNEGVLAVIPRGGVYYEAGFAQGLGIPVIWCCREDQISYVHFDTRQFNHITWTGAADLRLKLTNRIRAVIR